MPDLRKIRSLAAGSSWPRTGPSGRMSFPRIRSCTRDASARSAKETNTPHPARFSLTAIPARTPTARVGECASCRTSFPRSEIEGDLQKRGDGIYDMMRGVGAHEVIIESPEHLLSTSELTRKATPRGVVGLSRPAGGPEERPPAGLWHDLQERRRGGRRLAGAFAQPIDRHADRADERARKRWPARWSFTTIAAAACSAT